jgi:hypothetical protein
LKARAGGMVQVVECLQKKKKKMKLNREGKEGPTVCAAPRMRPFSLQLTHAFPLSHPGAAMQCPTELSVVRGMLHVCVFPVS